jgi:serine/threonine-protein kinase HipA
MNLEVKLLGDRVGVLSNNGGSITFRYDESYTGSGGQPLSISLPLSEEPYGRREALAYFGNLLPDGEYRELMARAFGVSTANAFALLAEIGRDCAGAVVIIPEDLVDDEEYLPPIELSQDELAERLRDLRNRVAGGPTPVERMSLAGAQAKLAVIRNDHRSSIPQSWLDPTTHILKPQSPHFKDVVENEGFCLRLAELTGIPTAESSIEYSTDGESYLCVRRYDRDPISGARLHQEDFCQARAIPAETRYQDEGGPSIADLFETVDQNSGVPARDKLQLWRAIGFNYLIGNCDAHGKNFSLVYESRVPSLAPLYDLVSTSVYPLTTKLAMRIGDAHELDQVTVADFERAALSAGLAVPNAMSQLRALADRVSGLCRDHPELQTHDSPIVDRVVEGIHSRAGILLAS